MIMAKHGLRKKKILLVAAEDSGHRGPCERALLKLGYDVVFFNYRRGLYFRNKIVRKIYRTIPGAKNLLKRRISLDFLKKVKETKPDYVFSLSAELILPEAVVEAKAMGVVTINWFLEYIWKWEANVKLASVYDLFFSSDPYVLKKLKQEKGLNNCFCLPQAFDLKDGSLNPFENRREEYDLAVVASYSSSFYSHRTNTLDAIKDLGLNIWGPKGWLTSPLKGYYRGKANGDEVLEIYRKTKIVPNTHYKREPAEAITLRPFEAMGSGAMLVSDDVRSSIFELFKDGEEFISFHDGDTDKLREIIKHYINHPEERIRIAKRGYEKVIASHTYQVRMKNMMDIANSHLN